MNALLDPLQFATPIEEYINDTISLVRKLDRGAISRATQLLLSCYRRHGRIFTMGNGGSASTAQHFACDLSKYVIPKGARPFDARCLTDNVSLYTAWANDADRNDVFVNQMKGILTDNDLVILVSVHGGTGFSQDLVRALRFSNDVGAQSIALVGFDGGFLHENATTSLLVPAGSTPHTEGLHLVIEHLLMHLIAGALAPAQAET